ncbi:MAG: flagellar export protein FliJ [Desulfuromonadales bacterium]
MAVMRFELEQVLGYRREMEKLRKQDFATSKQNLEKASTDLRRGEEQVSELSEEFRCRQQELGCIDEMRMYSDFFNRKRVEIKYQKVLVEQLDLVLNERREDLLEASKDKKVLESLKVRKTREFLLEMEQKERKFLDEISIQKKAGPD